MQKTLKVTLLVVPVVALVSLFQAQAAAASINAVKPTTNIQKAQLAQSQKLVLKADQVEKKEASNPEPQVGIAMQVSRSTSLYDHDDGSRSDSMDYLVMPQMKLGFGTLKAKIVYSQNLRENGNTYDGTAGASDWGDVSVTAAKNPYKWMWSYPYMITLTPFVSGVIPASQNSMKRDELKTAISTGVSFGVIPDGIAPQSDGFWSFAIGVTAGRNIHSYETDINGKILNKYSSNQTVNFSYNYKDFSFGVEFINKSRWTYQGGVRSAFEHSQEIGYNINDNFSLALGHSNGGSSLKANGLDSNLELVNENDSSVYATLGLSF